MTTYYCPRGCQECSDRTAAALGFECGACGSTMTRDSTGYDDVLQSIEDRGIAEMERKMKE